MITKQGALLLLLRDLNLQLEDYKIICSFTLEDLEKEERLVFETHLATKTYIRFTKKGGIRIYFMNNKQWENYYSTKKDIGEVKKIPIKCFLFTFR